MRVARAFVLLTKVTPGIGLLWFAARGEWRSLAMAVGATGLIAAASFLVAPGLWFDWIALLAASAGTPQGIPLAFRLPIAAVLVVWGARTDRRWTVVVAAMLALPAMWPAVYSMLVALGQLAVSDHRTFARGRLSAGWRPGGRNAARTRTGGFVPCRAARRGERKVATLLTTH